MMAPVRAETGETMAKQEPFSVQAFVANFTGTSERFADNLSYRPLRETLRLAAELCGGIPGAWVGIRYKGQLIAEVETDHRGELREASVHANYKRHYFGRGCYPPAVVTPLNVHGPIFAGVFAS